MASKFELVCLFVMLTATFSSGEMFLERGVYSVNMSVDSQRTNTRLSIQKSMFANSEVGVQVLSCTSDGTEDSSCDFTIEWMIRQSDCDGIYNNLFQDSSNATRTQQVLKGLYEKPNCFYMEEEQTVSYLQSWLSWPNPPIHVDDKGVTPVFLRDLKKTGMDCSKRDPKSTLCKTLPLCGVGVAPGNATADNAANTGGNAANTGDSSRRKKREATPAEPIGTAANKSANETKLIKSRVIHTNDKDGRFIFILSLSKINKSGVNVTLKVQLKSPSGYLSATQYPLLPFYGAMCAVYSVFGLVWLVLLFRQWKDLLRVQFWISVVIILGLIEKAAFVAEFDRHNKTGESSNTGVFIAEELSVLKRTVARMLVIIVSLGYGITRPRLGRDLNWVMGAGSLFFILSSMEVYFRITQSGTNSLIALLPLSILEAVLCWWIFRSLVETTRTLRLRRNLVKLWLYRHLTNALIFCIVAAVIFLVWSLKVHKMNNCVKEWNEIWLDDAYWHILFCVILMVIMILIRPSANNQRYAYSMLSDAADDDEESKEPMMNDAFETVKMRNVQSNKTTQDRRDDDDLQWVEDNIPAAVADAALAAFDDSEEELITSVERSKME